MTGQQVAKGVHRRQRVFVLVAQRRSAGRQRFCEEWLSLDQSTLLGVGCGWEWVRAGLGL